MKAEIYITNLIKTSTHARRVVANLLGHRVFPDTTYLLLRLPAKETLTVLSARLNCAQDEVFAHLAAQVRHNYERPATDEVRLDALALVYIRQRIKWVVEQLREQAQDLADEVGAIVPTDSDLARLHLYMMLYELRSPARAWRVILNLRESAVPTIREAFSSIDMRSTGMSGTPRSGSSLQTRTEEIWSKPSRWQFWKQPRLVGTNLIVSCPAEEFGIAVDVLLCQSVPSAQIPALAEFFASLPADVGGQGWITDIGARLLDARLISLQSPRDVIMNACLTLFPEIISGLVLAGVDLPGGVNPLWGDQLSYKLPITPVLDSHDTIFPTSRAHIMDLVRQEHPQESNWRVVE